MSLRVDDASPADRSSWLRRRLTWWIAGGAALVVIVGVVGFALARPNSPATVVRNYLAALSRGDLSAATAIARPDQPHNASTTFLDRASLSTGWKVRGVTESDDDSGDDDDNDDAETSVRAAISGVGGITTGSFNVIKEDGTWRIPNPYVTVSIRASSLRYVDVNGKQVRRAVAGNDNESSVNSRDTTYVLYPGDYRFYSKPSPSVRITARPRTLLPERIQDTATSATPMESVSASADITPAGLVKVQQAVRARVDRCVHSTELDPEDCPFGLGDNQDRVNTPSGEFEVSSFIRVRWKVASYPTVSVAPNLARGDVVTTGMGAVTLTGMGRGEDDKTVPFTTTCRIAEPYDVTFASDGTPTALAVIPYDNREYPC